MSMQKKPLLTLHVTPAAPVAAGLVVTQAGALPAAGGRVRGCLAQACTVAGTPTPIDVLGTSIGTAGAAFNPGDPLMATAAGKLVLWTSPNIQVGSALEAAAADGDRVEYLLIVN
ncbi:DUF2190 family protein [Hydrocarboniphaga effusa]|uniref:DUF2190 family protein n=1 Tax=Hydrocarboniphaga effusa TaxID=243629 RepID=UPI003BA967D6